MNCPGSPAGRLLVLLPAVLLLSSCQAGVGVPTAGPVPSATAAEQVAPVISAIAAALAPTWTPAAPPTPTLAPAETPSPSPTSTAAPCARPGRVVAGQYPSQIAGPQRRYRLYLPPCYSQDRRVYPTLYLFHGNIHDEGKWDELGLDEAAEAAIQAGEIPPLLVVMPDGGSLANNTSGGPSSFEDVVLNELIPFIEATTCAWPAAAGRSIGGLSRGGYWALEIAFRHPGQFASAGGHSAALVDVAAGPDLNPQHTGLANDLGSLRIYLDFGAEDYLIANTRKLHEDLAATGIPHTWVVSEGGHEDAYWAAHVREYLQWYAEPWPLDRSAYPPCGVAADQEG